MERPNHIVFTTIFVPNLLRDLQKNLSLSGRLDSTFVWVIGDRKTPSEALDVVQEVDSLGLRTKFVGIAEQDNWGKRCSDFYGRIPYNNETRRNIGYLMALDAGCDRIISIDDDNWPTADDFVGGHSLTGMQWHGTTLEEATGFHNVCEHLEFDVRRPIYPRGYPFRLRSTGNAPTVIEDNVSIVGVTAGLWLREPDVDATTWLNGKISAISCDIADHFALGPRTWTPINTQNTSVCRELIPAYLCIPMGYAVPGGRIERYGDIWGGYFLQAIIKDTPYRVCVGKPLVDHRRNPHVYVDDLRYEFWGMILTDWLVDLLKDEFHPVGQSIVNRVLQLSEFLHSVGVPALPTWCPVEVRAFIEETAVTLAHWSKVCSVVGGLS
jgi:hypothetical protein